MDEFDSKDVNIIVDDEVIVGLAEGSFVTCEQLEDNFTPYVGAKGEVAVAENNNKTGEIKITVQSESPSLRKLNQLANGKDFVPIQVIDLNNGKTVAGGTKARPKKPPTLTYADKVSAREVIFFVADYSQTIE